MAGPRLTLVRERDHEAVATAMERLEAEICNVSYMAGIVGDIFEDLFSRDLAKVGGRPDTYFVSEEQVNQHLFAVFHLQQMTKELRERFYAAGKARGSQPA